MNNYLSEYLYYIAGELNLSTDTKRAYERDLRQYLEYLSKYRLRQEPDEITVEDVRQFLSSLKRKQKSNITMARKLSAIKSFHRFLFKEKYVKMNVAKLIKSPKTEKKLPIVLSVEEVEKLLNQLTTDTTIGLRNKAMIELAYSSGLRVSELISLRFKDLHLEMGFLDVLGKGQKQELSPLVIKQLMR